MKMLDAFYDIVFSRKTRAQWLSKELLCRLPSGSVILNVGAGLGYLENELSNSSLHLISIEPGRTEVKNNIYATSFEQAVIVEKFDAVVFSYSLHHVPNPRQAIQKSFSSLKPNGKLYILEIVPPNKFWKVLSFDGRISCPWRIHSWSRSTLENIINSSEGKITEVVPYRPLAKLFIIEQK